MKIAPDLGRFEFAQSPPTPTAELLSAGMPTTEAGVLADSPPAPPA